MYPPVLRPPQQIPSPRAALFDCSDEFLNSLLNVLADLNLDEKSFLLSLSLSLCHSLVFCGSFLSVWAFDFGPVLVQLENRV